MLDVKVWDDETDMVKLEEAVRSIKMDGLLWGTSKLIPVAYGVKKLQITCVIEDDKVRYLIHLFVLTDVKLPESDDILKQYRSRLFEFRSS